ncbi:hypothetical protein M8J77_016844 [Diaphorina citri]|nr:hypothetical protein M8J77_016844 [Diaphorina citri]
MCEQSPNQSGLRRAWASVCRTNGQTPQSMPDRNGTLRRSLRQIRTLFTKGSAEPDIETPQPSTAYKAVPPPAEDPNLGRRVLISRLSDRSVFSCLRKYLAFFLDRRDVCMDNGDSYLSLRSYLESMGLPCSDEALLREVYKEFLLFRGMTCEDIQADLRSVRGVIYGRYLSEVERRQSRIRVVPSPSVGRCDPECTIL